MDRGAQLDGVSQLTVGEVRAGQTGACLGQVANLQSSQRPAGQVARYLREKAMRRGMG